MKRGSFELMKKMNQQVIFRLIHTGDSISRAVIAEESGLSPATVSNIVGELLEMGLIRETNRGESRGGRKPVLLEINPDGAYFIGLEWGISEVRGVLLDLSHNVIAYSEKDVYSYDLESFVQLSTEIIARFIGDSIDRGDVDSKDIYGIGLGVHGMVDPEQGVSLFAPHFGWKNLNLRERLEKEFELPVVVDNDVRAMAMAEKWEGRDNFLFVNTGSGIGAAIVTNGELYYGRDYSAGEFGHMIVEKDGPLCSCGNRGCLESLVSTERLVKKYFSVSSVSYRGKDSKPHIEKSNRLDNEVDSKEIDSKEIQKGWLALLEDARAGKEEALLMIEDIIDYMGIGLTNLVNLFNPEEIILGGEYIRGEDLILPLLQEKVRENSLQIPGRELKVGVSRFREWVGAIGSATMVLQKLFNFSGGI